MILLDMKFSWSTLGGCGILGFLEKERIGKEVKHKKASGLAATSDFLASIELHVCFLLYFWHAWNMHVV